MKANDLLEIGTEKTKTLLLNLFKFSGFPFTYLFIKHKTQSRVLCMELTATNAHSFMHHHKPGSRLAISPCWEKTLKQSDTLRWSCMVPWGYLIWGTIWQCIMAQAPGVRESGLSNTQNRDVHWYILCTGLESNLSQPFPRQVQGLPKRRLTKSGGMILKDHGWPLSVAEMQFQTTRKSQNIMMTSFMCTWCFLHGLFNDRTSYSFLSTHPTSSLYFAKHINQRSY